MIMDRLRLKDRTKRREIASHRNIRYGFGLRIKSKNMRSQMFSAQFSVSFIVCERNPSDGNRLLTELHRNDVQYELLVSIPGDAGGRDVSVVRGR